MPAVAGGLRHTRSTLEPTKFRGGSRDPRLKAELAHIAELIAGGETPPEKSESELGTTMALHLSGVEFGVAELEHDGEQNGRHAKLTEIKRSLS
jgi:hypothetical protein